MSTETEDTVVEDEAPVDVLSLSDDDFINLKEDAFDDTSTDDKEKEDEGEEDTSLDTTETEEDQESEEEASESTTEDVVDEKNKEESTEDKDTTDSSINFEEEHKKLLSTFKANGKDFTVKDVEEARTLMQMGANYNKKMAGLKPVLKLVKMLENNELMDEEKLGFLIDLSKKDPDAITKLIKDSGINPLDVDVKADTTYKPKTYTVNDSEVELDSVLADIKDSESYTETIDIISNKWDEASRKVLLDNPTIIATINEHVGTKVYAQISSVIENERMLGRLKGVSDLEAYKQIGDRIQAAGGFDKQTPKATETVITKKVSTTDDSKLKSRKKAASTNRSSPTKKKVADFDPLSLSDEDFEKAAGKLNL